MSSLSQGHWDGEQIRTDLALTTQKTHNLSDRVGSPGNIPHLKKQKWGGQDFRCGGQEEQRCVSRKAPGMFEDSEPSAVWGQSVGHWLDCSTEANMPGWKAQILHIQAEGL